MKNIFVSFLKMICLKMKEFDPSFPLEKIPLSEGPWLAVKKTVVSLVKKGHLTHLCRVLFYHNSWDWSISKSRVLMQTV